MYIVGQSDKPLRPRAGVLQHKYIGHVLEFSDSVGTVGYGQAVDARFAQVAVEPHYNLISDWRCQRVIDVVVWFGSYNPVGLIECVSRKA